MSRYRGDKKTTVEECRSLSTSKLTRWDILKPEIAWTSGGVQWKNAAGEVMASIGYTFSQQPSPTLTLTYTTGKADDPDRRDLHYDVALVTTPCRFGGVRYWFLCPLVKSGYACRRKVASLYLPPGASYFGCRHCYRLTYESCQEHDARVDRLCQDPFLLHQMLNSPGSRASLLALKAMFKLRGDL